MPFEIIKIPRDDESVRLYVERYKAFRLLALKTDPDAFGSTYSREIAFTDDVWYNRLTNPKTATFIALQSDQIVCTLTAGGPLPCTPEESSPSKDPWSLLGTDPKGAAQSHWRMIGMFTLPAARGQGIAKALLMRAIQYGINEAGKSGKSFVGSIAVNDDNLAALALYKKCGFVPITEEPWFRDRPRVALLLKYSTGSGPNEFPAKRAS